MKNCVSLLIPKFVLAAIAAFGIQSQSTYAGVIYNWDFTQSATDTVNGVVATFGNPGGLGPQGYTFTDSGEGITVLQPPAVAVTGTYTIVLVFSLVQDTGGYQRIIDFQDYTTDMGLYVNDADFYFYDYDDSDLDLINVPFMQDMTFVITRNAATKVITGTLDGQQIWSFVDTGDFGVFNAASNVMHFFQDDSDEHPAGTVKSIRVSVPDAPIAATGDIAKAKAAVKKAKKALKKAKKSGVKSRIQKAKKKLKKSKKKLRLLLAS